MTEGYYELHKHSYMRYENDRLAALVHRWIDHPLLSGIDTAIELGAGMGRFSGPLLDRYRTVILEEPVPSYANHLTERFGGRARIVTESAECFLETYDGARAAIYCFHLMHHLTSSVRDRIYSAIARHGHIGILVEPNPINPLLLLQIAITPDMKFEEEKQYLTLGRRRYSRELASHGLNVLGYERFLLTPPVLANALLQRSTAAEKVLVVLEKARRVLPLLCSYQLIMFGRKP